MLKYCITCDEYKSIYKFLGVTNTKDGRAESCYYCQEDTYVNVNSVSAKVAKALKKSIIVKAKKCANCGDTEPSLHGHHHNYKCALDVEWLCPYCHCKIHMQKDSTYSKLLYS